MGVEVQGLGLTVTVVKGFDVIRFELDFTVSGMVVGFCG